MTRSSFSAIRKALEEHNREALLTLVGELYALNQQNRDFLETRYVGGESALIRYKDIIRDALYPNMRSSSRIRVRDAKKAIADYRKALGDDLGLAELSVYAAECGNQLTCDYGDIDEPFYDAMIRIFSSAVTLVSKLDKNVAGPLIDRLRIVVKKSERIGWGYNDAIADYFFDAFRDGDVDAIEQSVRAGLRRGTPVRDHEANGC